MHGTSVFIAARFFSQLRPRSFEGLFHQTVAAFGVTALVGLEAIVAFDRIEFVGIAAVEIDEPVIPIQHRNFTRNVFKKILVFVALPTKIHLAACDFVSHPVDGHGQLVDFILTVDRHLGTVISPGNALGFTDQPPNGPIDESQHDDHDDAGCDQEDKCRQHDDAALKSQHLRLHFLK